MLHEYEALRVFYGDLHSHCAVGYGYGTVEEAYANARTQLDFASVTAHAAWPDMPEASGALAATIEYHRRGFEAAARGWAHLLEVTRAVTEEGRFVAFPSFEWHSLQWGDHNVCYRDPEGELILAATLKDLQAAVRDLRRRQQAVCLIPHHIAYAPGHRGVRWAHFSEELSPVVEIFSLHGAAESEDAPYPYLHTMGPRDGRATMRQGLARGHVFGVIGSSDHHAAHPGSYGHGRAAVWARDLTRAALWEAIVARRTYALTGDRIVVALAVNGAPMGSVVPWAPARRIEVAVEGGAALDVIEVVGREGVLHRWSPPPRRARPSREAARYKVALEVGWGDRHEIVRWEVDLTVVGGVLHGVEPRIRGPATISPAEGGSAGAPTAVCAQAGNRVRFTARTQGNPTPLTPGTQGCCLELEGDASTRLVGTINGCRVDVSLDALRQRGEAAHLGGFRSPAYAFSRAAAEEEYVAGFSVTHQGQRGRPDWYYVRVRQVNGQWAWTSPVWVAGA